MKKKHIVLLLMIFAFTISPILFRIISSNFDHSRYSFIYDFIFIILFLFIPPCLLIYVVFYSYDYYYSGKSRLKKLKQKLIEKLSNINNFSELNIKYLGVSGLTADNIIEFYHEHSIFGMDKNILVEYELCINFNNGKMLPIRFNMCFDICRHIYYDNKIMSESEFVNHVYNICYVYDKHILNN